MATVAWRRCLRREHWKGEFSKSISPLVAPMNRPRNGLHTTCCTAHDYCMRCCGPPAVAASILTLTTRISHVCACFDGLTAVQSLLRVATKVYSTSMYFSSTLPARPKHIQSWNPKRHHDNVLPSRAWRTRRLAVQNNVSSPSHSASKPPLAEMV